MKGDVTMTNLTLYPADIAEMSVSQIARLLPLQKHEISKNLIGAKAKSTVRE